MFDPWTATKDEALAGQEAFQKEFKNKGPIFHEGPIFQWNAARYVERSRLDALSGKGFNVLSCIHVCVTNGLVAPEWLAHAFNHYYDQVMRGHVRSWDDVFCRPYPKEHLAKIRQRNEFREKVWSRVTELSLFECSAIDDDLFERVGREFGLRKTVCSELYYEAKRVIDTAK